MASHCQEQKWFGGRKYVRLQVHPESLEEDADGRCVGSWPKEYWDRAAESANSWDWMRSVCACRSLWLEDLGNCYSTRCKVVALIHGACKDQGRQYSKGQCTFAKVHFFDTRLTRPVRSLQSQRKLYASLIFMVLDSTSFAFSLELHQ